MSGVVAALLSLVLFSSGGCLMRSSNKTVLKLHWEAPAGREPSQKLVVRVDEMREPDKGMLGYIENHPSMAHSMPSPVEIQGTVVHRPADWSAPTITLRY